MRLAIGVNPGVDDCRNVRRAISDDCAHHADARITRLRPTSCASQCDHQAQHIGLAGAANTESLAQAQAKGNRSTYRVFCCDDQCDQATVSRLCAEERERQRDTERESGYSVWLAGSFQYVDDVLDGRIGAQDGAHYHQSYMHVASVKVVPQYCK